MFLDFSSLYVWMCLDCDFSLALYAFFACNRQICLVDLGDLAVHCERECQVNIVTLISDLGTELG